MNSRTNAPFRMTSTRLFLDHGLDEARCERIQLQPNGAVFECPWQFDVLAELRISVDFPVARRGFRRQPVEAVVVGSRRLGPGVFETTVLFLERLEELDWEAPVVLEEVE